MNKKKIKGFFKTDGPQYVKNRFEQKSKAHVPKSYWREIEEMLTIFFECQSTES